MGWYGTKDASRDDIVQDRIRPWGQTITLKHKLIGGVLWTIRESIVDGQAQKWIGCDLIECHGGMWGYKPLSEDMGPYEHTCPLAWFDEVPLTSGGYAAAFRERCRNHQRVTRVRREAELELAGVLGADGQVYSDADPGL